MPVLFLISISISQAITLDSVKAKSPAYSIVQNNFSDDSVFDKYIVKYGLNDHSGNFIFKIFDLKSELIYSKELNINRGISQDRILLLLVQKSNFLFRHENVLYYIWIESRFINVL